MPGYILHLTAAQMFLKQTKKEQELFVNKQETNNFLIGNLMPDTTKDKARSHFRDPKYQGNMVEYPEISWFARKYHNILHEQGKICDLKKNWRKDFKRRFFLREILLW